MTSASVAATRRRLGRLHRRPTPAEAVATVPVEQPAATVPAIPDTIQPKASAPALDVLVEAVQDTATKLEFMVIAAQHYCEVIPGFHQGDGTALGLVAITDNLGEETTALRERINDLTSLVYQPGARLVVDHPIRATTSATSPAAIPASTPTPGPTMAETDAALLRRVERTILALLDGHGVHLGCACETAEQIGMALEERSAEVFGVGWVTARVGEYADGLLGGLHALHDELRARLGSAPG